MKYETDKGVIARCHVNTSGAFGMLHWRTKCLLYFKLKEKKEFSKIYRFFQTHAS